MPMIGTSFEMLLYFSYVHGTAEVLGMSHQRLTAYRDRIARQNIDEDVVIKHLTKLSCTCIRPQVIVPAVIRDKSGRLFDENTYARLFLTEDIEKDICRKLKKDRAGLTYGGHLIERAYKIFLKTKSAHFEQPRITLPSVWSFDPYFEIPNHISTTVGRMIGYRDSQDSRPR